MLNSQVIELRKQIANSGVQLRVEDGQLRASGTEFPEDLRKAAGKHKAELALLIQIEQSEREAKLSEALASWSRSASEDRGFFIGSVRNVVTEHLRLQFDQAGKDYLAGLCDLRDVHAAFSAYAKATRRKFLSRQLAGSIFEPSLGGRRTSQAEIHAAFNEMHEEGDETDINSVFRTSVTPQIEPQDDQLARMEIYFGTNRTEYIQSRLDR